MGIHSTNFTETLHSADHLEAVLLLFILATVLMSLPVLVCVRSCCFPNAQRQIPNLEAFPFYKANYVEQCLESHFLNPFDNTSDPPPEYTEKDASNFQSRQHHLCTNDNFNQTQVRCSTHDAQPMTRSRTHPDDDTFMYNSNCSHWTELLISLPPPYENERVRVC